MTGHSRGTDLTPRLILRNEVVVTPRPLQRKAWFCSILSDLAPTKTEPSPDTALARSVADGRARISETDYYEASAPLISASLLVSKLSSSLTWMSRQPSFLRERLNAARQNGAFCLWTP